MPRFVDDMIPLLDDPRWTEHTSSAGARARPDVKPTGTRNVTDNTNLSSPAKRSAQQIREANRQALIGGSSRFRPVAPVVQPEVAPNRGTRPVPPPNIRAVPEPKVPPVPKYPNGFVSYKRPGNSGLVAGKVPIRLTQQTKSPSAVVDMKLDEPPTVAKARATINYGAVALALGVGAFALFKFA